MARIPNTENNGAHRPPRTLSVLARGNACLSCRRRKQRCDSQRPVCQNCIRSNRVHECVFEEQKKTRVDKLKDRVRELEMLIAQLEHQSRTLEPTTASIPGTPQTHNPSLKNGAPLQREITFSHSDVDLDEAIRTEVLNVPHVIEVQLLEVFFLHLPQFNFPISIQKFQQSLELGEDHPCHPHPALFNAILALAAHLSADPAHKEFESALLHRAHCHLDDCLAHVDRLLDFLAATIILARYCFTKGQRTKGIFYANSAMSFAVGCGMHTIHGDERSFQIRGLLPPPQDEAELVERINVFNSVLIIDREASIEAGALTAVLAKDITTPWPTRMGPHGHPPANLGFQVLSNPQTFQVSTETDTFLSIRVKTTVLLDRCLQHSRRAIINPAIMMDATFWEVHRSNLEILAYFRNSLPPIRDDQLLSTLDTEKLDTSQVHEAMPFIVDDFPSIERTFVLYSLIFAHIGIHVCGIHMNNLLASRSIQSRELILAAAAKAVEVVQVMLDARLEARDMHWLIPAGLASCGRALVEERQRLQQEGSNGDQIYMINGYLRVIRRGMEMLASFYNFANVYIADLGE